MKINQNKVHSNFSCNKIINDDDSITLKFLRMMYLFLKNYIFQDI